jgi:hypothetical protein
MTVYIYLNWQQEGPIDSVTGQRLWWKGRRICISTDYPKRLLCGNPKCEDGGFEIGPRIATLLASGMDSEQNFLRCQNATHKDQAKQCPHIIMYSIICIYAYHSSTAQEGSLTI